MRRTWGRVRSWHEANNFPQIIGGADAIFQGALTFLPSTESDDGRCILPPTIFFPLLKPRLKALRNHPEPARRKNINEAIDSSSIDAVGSELRDCHLSRVSATKRVVFRDSIFSDLGCAVYV